MTYLEIDDDERATLTIYPGTPSIDRLEDGHLRGMGYNKVYCPGYTSMVGWVSDVGHSMPEFRRNVVASCVMAAMGATPYPLAGPLVVTGYDYEDRESGFPERLGGKQGRVVLGAYLATLKALGMQSPEELEQYRTPEIELDEHLAAIRDAAAQFAAAEAPSLTFITPPDPRPQS